MKKLAYLNNVELQKTAGIGATLTSLGSKALSAGKNLASSQGFQTMGSKVLSAGKNLTSNQSLKSIGSKALTLGQSAMQNPVARNAIVNGTTGAITGAVTSQKDANGRSHRLKDAMIGGTIGAGLGAGFGLSTQYAPQIKNFGNSMKQQFQISAAPKVNDVSVGV